MPSIDCLGEQGEGVGGGGGESGILSLLTAGSRSGAVTGIERRVHEDELIDDVDHVESPPG